MKKDKKLGGLTSSEVLNLKNLDTKIECIKCREILPIKKFSFSVNKNNKKYYLSYECYDCGYKRKLEKHGHKTSLYNATQLYKQDNTVHGRASLLYNRCRQRSKKYGYDFNLNKQLIIDKLSKGICEATGISFVIDGNKYNPYMPSIDRIDSNLGYINENIQVVCMIYNFCKNKFTDEQTKKFIKDAKQYGIY